MRHSSFLEVDLKRLGDNFQKIRDLAPRAIVLPMVKADAYGNGLVPVSRFLVEECGANKLGCATLGEALALCREMPELVAEILVFSEIELQDEKIRRAYLDFNITPVMYRPKDLDLLLKDKELQRLPIIIKINTGMNRLGLTLEELSDFAPRLRARGVQHLMTHFACPYYPLKLGDKTYRQFDEFLKAKKILSDANVELRETSVSSSGAIEQGFGIDETYIRPGLMMYGPSSMEARIWEGHQISRLVTKVLKTFHVKKGTPVGYGIHVAAEDHYMAIVALGYGDGITTFASGTLLNVKGMRARVFGRVNMDMTFLAFDPSAEGKINEDESVEIWNNDNRVISDLANQMKTHPYQLMCGITQRVPRIYL
jgi:alanine racemase